MGNKTEQQHRVMRERIVKGTKERAEAWNMKGKKEEGNKAKQHGIQRE